MDQGDSVGASALFRACQYGAPVATLQALVRAGADVNKVEEENGTPPIQVACVRKHTALVRWLADPAGGNADVDLLNRQGGNVLCVAAMQGDQELATFVPGARGKGARGSGFGSQDWDPARLPQTQWTWFECVAHSWNGRAASSTRGHGGAWVGDLDDSRHLVWCGWICPCKNSLRHEKKCA